MDDRVSRLQEFMIRQHLLLTLILSLIVQYVKLRTTRARGKKPTKEVSLLKKKVRDELLNEIRYSEKSYDIIRMGPQAFEKLCKILHDEGGLRSTQRVSLEEQVAKFLHILSHNVRNRTIAFFFRTSTASTSRHFHRVLRAIIELEDKFLKQPNGAQVPSEIRSSTRFYPYFKVISMKLTKLKSKYHVLISLHGV